MQAHLTDKRDKRGKKHNLAFVLTSFMMAIFRTTGYIDLSCIHRRMLKEHDLMVKDCGFNASRCISYVQLGRILQGLDYQMFNEINDRYFAINIQEAICVWCAIDGKELRGNIDGVSGEKRGENVVKCVNHEDFSSQIIGFYHGGKESEKTIVQEYFSKKETLTASYSFDALHTCPSLLENIDKKGGHYLAQVKKNQVKLLDDCEHTSQYLPFIHTFEQIEKGHGRLEIRTAKLYTLQVATLDERWKNSGLKTLIAVNRHRTQLKNNKISEETAYFISNKLVDSNIVGLELIGGVRNHWSVESDNYVKDVTIGEDNIRCKNSNRIRSIASVINTAVNLIRRKNIVNNIRQIREDCNYDRNKAKSCLSTS